MKITIPIIIDAIKQFQDFDFSRCSFFSIECDECLSPIPARRDLSSPPFYQPNISGMPRVIFKPIDGTDVFDTVKKIDDLFDLVEDDDTFYIDTNDIFLPNTFFKDSGRLAGEDVFRIPTDVFDAALWARERTLNRDRLLRTCSVHPKGAQFEPLETKAFQDWGKQQINETKSRYHANRNNYLTKI